MPESTWESMTLAERWQRRRELRRFVRRHTAELIDAGVHSPEDIRSAVEEEIAQDDRYDTIPWPLILAALQLVIEILKLWRDRRDKSQTAVQMVAALEAS